MGLSPLHRRNPSSCVTGRSAEPGFTLRHVSAAPTWKGERSRIAALTRGFRECKRIGNATISRALILSTDPNIQGLPRTRQKNA